MIELLKATKKEKILFLTGSGLSVDSGIPSFRGSEGSQSKATRAFFDEDPKGYWDWATSRFKTEAIPNKGHTLIDDSKCPVITQNVDGLHANAIEIHGNHKNMKCTQCDCCGNSSKFKETVPKCIQCGSDMIPDILNFDENYSEYILNRAMHLAYNSQILICVGTTITTGLPESIWSHFKIHNRPIIFINPDNIYVGRQSDYFIQKTAIESLPKICEAIAHED